MPRPIYSEEEEKRRQNILKATQPSADHPKASDTHAAQQKAIRERREKEKRTTVSLSGGSLRSGVSTTPTYKTMRVNLNDMTDAKAFDLASRMETDEERDTFFNQYLTHIARESSKNYRADVPTLKDFRAMADASRKGGVYSSTKASIAQTMGAFDGMIDVTGDAVNMNTADLNTVIRAIRATADDDVRKSRAKAFETLTKTQGSRFYGASYDADALDTFLDSAQLTSEDYNEYIEDFAAVFSPQPGKEAENREAYGKLRTQIEALEDGYLRQTYLTALDKAYRSQTASDTLPDMAVFAREQEAAAQETAKEQEEAAGNSWLTRLIEGLSQTGAQKIAERVEETKAAQQAAQEAAMPEPYPTPGAPKASTGEWQGPVQKKPEEEPLPPGALGEMAGPKQQEKPLIEEIKAKYGEPDAQSEADAEIGMGGDAQASGTVDLTGDLGRAFFEYKETGRLGELTPETQQALEALQNEPGVGAWMGILGDEEFGRFASVAPDGTWHEANNERADVLYAQSAMRQLGTNLMRIYNKINAEDFPAQWKDDAFMAGIQFIQEANAWAQSGGFVSEVPDHDIDNLYEAYARLHGQESSALRALSLALQEADRMKAEQAQAAALAADEAAKTEQQLLDEAIAAVRTDQYTQEQLDRVWNAAPVTDDVSRCTDSGYLALYDQVNGEWMADDTSWIDDIAQTLPEKEAEDLRFMMGQYLFDALGKTYDTARFLGYASLDEYAKACGGITLDTLHDLARIEALRFAGSLTPQDMEAVYRGTGAETTLGERVAKSVEHGYDSAVGGMLSGFYTMMAASNLSHDSARVRATYDKDYGLFGETQLRADLYAMVEGGYIPNEELAQYIAAYLNAGGNPYELGLMPDDWKFVRKSAVELKQKRDAIGRWAQENLSPDQGTWFEVRSGMTDNAVRMTVSAALKLGTGSDFFGTAIGFGLSSYEEGAGRIYAKDAQTIRETGALPKASTTKWANAAGFTQMTATTLSEYLTFGKWANNVGRTFGLLPAVKMGASEIGLSGTARLFKGALRYTGGFAKQEFDEVVLDELKEGTLSMFGERWIDGLRALDENGELSAIRALQATGESALDAIRHTPDVVFEQVLPNALSMSLIVAPMALLGAGGEMKRALPQSYKAAQEAAQTGSPAKMAAFHETFRDEIEGAGSDQIAAADQALTDVQIASEAAGAMMTDPEIGAQVDASAKAQEAADSHRSAQANNEAVAQADLQFAQAAQERMTAGEVNDELPKQVAYGVEGYAKNTQGAQEHAREAAQKQQEADAAMSGAVSAATAKGTAQVRAQRERAKAAFETAAAGTEQTDSQARMAQIEARMDEIGALYEANPELEDPALDEESEQLANEYGALQEAQEAAGGQAAAPMPEGMEEDAPLFESERQPRKKQTEAYADDADFFMSDAEFSSKTAQPTEEQIAREEEARYQRQEYARMEMDAMQPVFRWLSATGVYVNDSQKANILHATGLKSLQQVNFRYGFKLTNDASKGAMPLDGHFFTQLAEESGGRIDADATHPEDALIEIGETKKRLRKDMQASVGETIHEAYVEDAGAYYGTKDPVTQQMASDIYKSTGLTVVVAPLANRIRAVYDRESGRVILSNRIGAGLAKAQAAMHELTHYIEGSSGYEAYKKAALDAAYFGDTDGVMQGADAEQIRDTYAQSGIVLDEAGVESELVAQATEKIIADESGEIVRRLLSQGKRGFVVRLKNLLMQFLARRKAKREGRLAQYDAIQNAYKLFKDALESRGKWAQGEAGSDVTIDLDAAKRQQDEVAYGAVGEQMQYALGQSATHYDYAKPFSEQVDDWLAGRIPQRDTLLIGRTPEVLRNIGFSDLPLTIDQKHMRYILGVPKNADHDLGVEMMKSLPELIANPVAIIENGADPSSGVMVILSAQNANAEGRPVIGAVNVRMGGSFNGITVEATRLATLHSRGDLMRRIEEAVRKEQEGGIGVYYANKKEATSLLESGQSQVLSTLVEDGFIHSISEDASPVNHVPREQSQTPQFRRWFSGSKMVDEDGNPLVMYRGGNQQINVFDRKKSSHSNLYGRGFYFTADESTARSYGEVERFYLSVKKPLVAASGKRDITPEQIRRFLEAVAEDEDYGIENYGYGATVDSVAKSLRGKNDFDVLQDINATCIGDFVAAIELFNRVNGTNYDGIVTPTETVVFRSEQIKSADRNVGLFDPLNPDVRYALAPNQFGNETAQRMTTISQTVKDLLAGSEHEVVTNQAQLDAAWEKVNADGLDATAANLLAKGDWDAQDNAAAALCMVLASQQGDETTAAAIAMRLDTEGAKQGRALQVRQMFLRLTPEGAMGEMIRKAERINQGAGIPAGSFPIGEGAPKTGGTTTDEATGTKTTTPPKAQAVYDEAESLQEQLDALPGDVSTGNPWGLPLADWQMALIKKFRLTGVKLPGINYNIATKKQRMLSAVIATDPRAGKDAQKTLCQQLVAIDKNHAVVTAADLRYKASQIAEFKALEGADATVPTTQAGREALGRAMQAQDNIIPVGFFKKWASLRYLNMLSAPATAVRNVASNVISGGLETVSTGIATAADISVAKKTGNRTTSLPTKAERSEANRAFAAEIARTFSDYFIAHVDTGHGRKYDVGGQGRVFEPEWLEACRNFVDFTMQIGDRPFYEKTYAQELAIIKRLGMKTYETKDGKRVQRPMTEAEMHAEATVRALHRVYQENSEMAEIVAKLRGMNPTMDLIISTLVPFVKTPTNVAMRAMEYSPVGLANALIRRATRGIDTGALGSISQRDYVMGIGRGLTGTGLLTAGVLLAAAGYLKFGRGEEENKNRREVLTSLYEPYGMYIEIGGQKREIDWALPASAALATGAELVRGLDDGEGFGWALATAIVSGLGDQLMDTPMLSGLSEIFRGYDDTEDMLIRLAKTEATSLMNQTFSPSIIRAIAKATDPYVRDTSSQSEVMSILSGSVVQYWPVFRQMFLAAKTDVTGEKMLQSGYYSWGKETQNAALHMLDSFFTPTATIGEKNDEALFELLDLSYRLQQEGESFTLPAALVGENGRLNVTKTLAGKTGTGDAGYTIQLTDDQRREANRLYGDLLFNGMRGVSYTMPNGVKKYDASDLTGIRVMMESGEWAALTDKERADRVDKMRAKAKEIVTLMAIRDEL